MIRAFAPHNGQLHFTIHNAHTKAVSTIAVTNDGARLISGGCDGQVIYYTFCINLIDINIDHD